MNGRQPGGSLRCQFKPACFEKKKEKSAHCEHWDDSAGLKTLFIASLAGNMMHVKSDSTIRGGVGERGLMKLLWDGCVEKTLFSTTLTLQMAARVQRGFTPLAYTDTLAVDSGNFLMVSINAKPKTEIIKNTYALRRRLKWSHAFPRKTYLFSIAASLKAKHWVIWKVSPRRLLMWGMTDEVRMT